VERESSITTDDDDDMRALVTNQAPSARSRYLRPCGAVAVLVGAVLLLARSLHREFGSLDELHLVTWNIAAINNNPFEYWITHEDADYNKLMTDVQAFIDAPAERDVAVSSVFTDAMWTDLKAEMAGRGWSGLEETEAVWRGDFSARKIISGFMKDGSLGEKRLASMPDRYTNTINLADGKKANRPTVINCYAGDMTTLPKWWSEWKRFMFHTKLTLPGGSRGPMSTEPAGLLSKISRSKYPAVTAAEEAISIPLQTLAQAIFDAILVHIVSTVSPSGKWQQLQQQMCDALNRRKDEVTIDILRDVYDDAHVVFLQEAAAAFVKKAEDSVLGEHYVVARSSSLDGKRDQNSVILLCNQLFTAASVQEHTQAVMSSFDKSVPVANGDLLVISAVDVVGRKYLLASFHGDTNGLATLRVLEAVHKLALTMPSHTLLFGLDANTYERGSASKQGVTEFARDFVAKGYSSCWGDSPDPKRHTTYNARTFLQAQLQKAARADEKISKGDKNPKDFILFPARAATVLQAGRDNTGAKQYDDSMVFPTLKFPSDHGIVHASLKLAASAGAKDRGALR